MTRAREIAGLSQVEAAARLGYAAATQLSNMESGNRPVPLRVLMQAAALYGCTMDFLCGLRDDADIDPAVTATRQVSGLISADIRRLVGAVTRCTVDMARELLPATADGQRVASLGLEVSSALATYRKHCTDFDDTRGSATLAAKVSLLSAAAQQYARQVERSKRLMTERMVRTAANEPIGFMSLFDHEPTGGHPAI